MISQSLRLFKISFKLNKSNYKYLFFTLFLEAVSITLLYNLNKQYGFLYQGIQDYKQDLIWKSVITFSSIAAALVVVNGYISFITNKLAFGIREGLTNFYTSNILVYGKINNIEQRIQEDLREFGKLSCEFWLTVLKAAVKLPLFLGVIISLTSWYIGLIIVVVVILGTLATKLISKKLILYQSMQETNEAEFRKSIIERKFFEAWIHVKSSFSLINKQIKKLTFLQSGLGQTFVLLPFIILLPLYISKTISMGQFFQSVNALSKVIDSLTVFIDNRQLLANIQTCLLRMEVLK